ncbi:MAG: hypothetical protein AB7T31_15020 [Gemmatimonadales bacterium]
MTSIVWRRAYGSDVWHAFDRLSVLKEVSSLCGLRRIHRSETLPDQAPDEIAERRCGLCSRKVAKLVARSSST